MLSLSLSLSLLLSLVSMKLQFEHACHVTLSVAKLLKRLTTPEILHISSEDNRAMHLHDYTYGINSDPLAIFAMTFSALIHDGKIDTFTQNEL